MAKLFSETVLLTSLLLPALAIASSTPTSLVPGGSETSTLTPGDVDAYEAELRSGEFLLLAVEQQTIDVVVSVTDPAGHRLAEIDNPEGQDVPESVAWVAETDGPYRVEVRPLPSATAQGRYRLLVQAWRAATPNDRLWATAVETTNAAHGRATRRTSEDRRAATDAYRRASELWRRLGESGEEARALRNLGQQLYLLGEDLAAALTTLEQALALERRRGNPAGIAATLNEIGRVHYRRGEHDRALQTYGEALALWRDLGNASREARVHNNMAVLLHAKGELRQALARYGQALAVYRRLEDRRREAQALTSIGHLHEQLGRPDRAVADFERVLKLCQTLGRRDIEADALNNLGFTLHRLGERHEALERYSGALEIYRELGRRRRQAAVLNSQGTLLLELGATEEARQLLLTAARLLEPTPDPYYQGRILLGLGVAASELGEHADALDLFARALDLQRPAGDRVGQALTLRHQAITRLRTGHPDLAHDLARQALSIFVEVGDVGGETEALRTFGQTAAALGQADTARGAFTSAASRAAEIGAVTEQARCRRELGRLERDEGRLAAALDHLERALGLFESLRAKISGEPLRRSHFAAVREAYELAIDTLMQLHDKDPEAGFDRRAFALSERARARGLLDVLRRGQVADGGNDPEILARERELRRELNALARQRRPADPDARQEQILTLTAEYRLLHGRLAPLPELGEPGVRGLAPSTHLLDEVTAWQDSDTVLVEITLGEPRSYLWVLAGATLESFELPGRGALETLAQDLHRHLRQPTRDRGRRQAALDELSRIVLAPAFPWLETRRWVIVPEGALYYVPFAALPVPSRKARTPATVPLMVEHEVVLLPSAAVLGQARRARRSPAAGRLAILADPVYESDDPRRHRGAAGEETVHEDAPGTHLHPPTQPKAEDPLVRLPWTGREARAIVEQVDGDGVLLALGLDASRELATSADLGRYRVVHFATHGVLDTQHPELSGLAFSRWDDAGRRRESFLRLHDVYPLQWQSELVVLSGCRTALGRQVRGEGLVGLAQGFLHAGAAQVVASLWTVRDQATAELMRRFYRGLFQAHLTPAAALRAAQISLWRERRWRDPYFWAPFILIGDWLMGDWLMGNWQAAETRP